MIKAHEQQGGFTIVELMIASIVFSTILLICTMGIIQVGRLYFRGIVASRTQEAARAVLDEVGQRIQFSGEPVTHFTNGFCIGKTKYSYRVDGPNAPNNNPAMVRHENDVECPSGSPSQQLTGGVNVLPENIRIVDISPPPTTGSVTNGLYAFGIHLAYQTTGETLLTGNTCPQIRLGGQFCATANLSTTVQKRI